MQNKFEALIRKIWKERRIEKMEEQIERSWKREDENERSSNIDLYSKGYTLYENRTEKMDRYIT